MRERLIESEDGNFKDELPPTEKKNQSRFLSLLDRLHKSKGIKLSFIFIQVYSLLKVQVAGIIIYK